MDYKTDYLVSMKKMWVDIVTYKSFTKVVIITNYICLG